MRKELIEKIQAADFSCRLCGACCSGADNEVMVTPVEVDTLIEATGLSFAEIAEPYPDWMEYPDGTKITFGWVLRRGADGNCMFLQENRCTVYASRPHICRTYPFMLDGDELIVSECPAVGCSVCSDAEETADALLCRRDAEDMEFTQSEKQYQKHSIASGSTVIIDSRGVHLWK
ncbi:MAG: YkgJ family cysteine cluster protein [Methanocorpusculum parvum]|nr:YkgJ family cysteine cluster protein [Methanocorpusculum parvum]